MEILEGSQIQTKAVHISIPVWIPIIPTYSTLIYTVELSQRGQPFRCNYTGRGTLEAH